MFSLDPIDPKRLTLETDPYAAVRLQGLPLPIPIGQVINLAAGTDVYRVKEDMVIARHPLKVYGTSGIITAAQYTIAQARMEPDVPFALITQLDPQGIKLPSAILSTFRSSFGLYKASTHTIVLVVWGGKLFEKMMIESLIKITGVNALYFTADVPLEKVIEVAREKVAGLKK